MKVEQNKWARLFILSAGILLTITGTAKIISAFGKNVVLAKPDPLYGIPFAYLLLTVGFIELLIAVFCFTSSDQNLASGLVAVLSLNFLAYRVGLWLIGWHGYCPCMGTLTQAIHLSRRQANFVTQVILTYLILGSFFCLAYAWSKARKERWWRSLA